LSQHRAGSGGARRRDADRAAGGGFGGALKQAEKEAMPQRLPSWLPALLLALIGFAAWTLFSLWPWLMHTNEPFRIREAWDTLLFWRVGVPVMLLAQAAGGALSGGRIWWQPFWMLGGVFAGLLLVHRSSSEFGLFPLTLILIGIPGYLALLAAAAVGRALADFLAE
jgi:hypothetical protein